MPKAGYLQEYPVFQKHQERLFSPEGPKNVNHSC